MDDAAALRRAFMSSNVLFGWALPLVAVLSPLDEPRVEESSDRSSDLSLSREETLSVDWVPVPPATRCVHTHGI